MKGVCIMKFQLVNKISGLLSNPGDTFIAKITPTGKQVAKLVTENKKVSSVTYGTGTTVVTEVFKHAK